MDNYPISGKSLEKFYHVNGDLLVQQYKKHLSDYPSWAPRSHADKWLLFPGNLGPRLSIDESSLSRGELYTIVTNKDGHGGKGTLVAIIEGVKAVEVSSILRKLPRQARHRVLEITLDMSSTMHAIARECFPNAEQVIDRFHVQKLACDALQELRIEHRWEAINEETNEMENARLEGRKYRARKFRNGETRKEILFRSRLLLFKDPAAWNVKQRKRASVLFELYPDIQKAFALVQRLRRIYSSCKSVAGARLKLALWYNQVNEAGFHSFNSVAASVFAHSTRILNFFNNRSTNASAETFNAKLKDFRAQFWGVLDIKFFLFRVAKIFA